MGGILSRPTAPKPEAPKPEPPKKPAPKPESPKKPTPKPEPPKKPTTKPEPPKTPTTKPEPPKKPTTKPMPVTLPVQPEGGSITIGESRLLALFRDSNFKKLRKEGLVVFWKRGKSEPEQKWEPVTTFRDTKL